MSTWISFPLARNRVIPQPLGVVGVIVPWNFPLNLSFVPLTYDLRRRQPGDGQDERELAPPGGPADREDAGLLPAREAAVLRRDRRRRRRPSRSCPSTTCCSPARGDTGRAVMAAAARNLCPVTLELGGKVAGHRRRRLPARHRGRTHPVRQVPERRSDLHHGRPCLAARGQDRGLRPPGAGRSCQDATRRSVRPTTRSIIDERAFERLLGALDEARERGARVVPLLPGPAFDAATRKIAPHTRARRARGLRADAARDLRPDPAAARLTASSTR